MTETPIAPALPSVETGYVNGDSTAWQQWDDDERIPELQWPDAVHVYRRMVREDGRVASLLQAIGLPIRRTKWRIDPAGARPEVTEFVADNMGLPIVGEEVPDDNETVAVSRRAQRDRFSWPAHLQTALLMLRYGHSYFEQVYRPPGEDGLYRLRKLAPRPQTTISKINVARDGGLVSITQRPPSSEGGTLYVPTVVDIPVSRLVAYVRDPEPGSWIGTSLLRPAYKHWLLKDELLRIQAAAIRRNGMGVPVITTARDDDTQVKRAQTIASSFRAGNASGVGLPNGWTMQLLGVQGNLPDIGKAIEYNDKQIALAGLAHFLNLDRGGSYALASVQADTFVQSVQTEAETVCETANLHIVEDLVDINWGPDEPAPRIVFDEIGTRQDATAAALKMLVDAGLISPDVLLERSIRQNLGMPAPLDDASADEPETATTTPSATPALAPAPVAAGRRRSAKDQNQGELF